MAIITISRGSYSHGKEIAEKVGQKLGYEVISREVLIEASRQFNVPEVKLIHAIKDAPSWLDSITYGREKYIAYIQAAILRHFKRDNVVYHGFAGHFFVKNVPHVLKVRIIADMEERIKLVMERDGVSRDEAIKQLTKIDEERRKWSQRLYGIDTFDPHLYDLVIRIKKLKVDDAVDIICHTVSMDAFKTTPESQMMMDNLVMAADIKAAIVHLRPDAEVNYESGVATVHTTLPLEVDETDLKRQLEETCLKIPGVREVRIRISPATIFKR
ncbi:MAG: cytidylate kinase-like family protein [Thermodesulforhabdaceae bacterium]